MKDALSFTVYSAAHLPDLPKLDQVYLESSEENAADWYPELSKAQALEKYQDGHHHYLSTEFFPQSGLLMVLESGDVYLSALRLYPQEPDRFFMEALETAPVYRGSGYAKVLLQEMMLYLHTNYSVCSVRSHVSKKNKASIRAHLSAGFWVEKDYVMDAGVHDGSRMGMLWDNSRLSRISRFENMLDRLSAPNARALYSSEQIRAELACLEHYYTGRLWLEDYSADEAGMLPQKFKRGVLSQDGIDHLLSEFEDLRRGE